MATVVFCAPVSRRMHDPVEKDRGMRHVLFCRASEMPEGLPLDPNPRQTQKLDRQVYRDVALTLRNRIGEPNTFHLKNKGITIVASKVTFGEDKSLVYVDLKQGDGILDGGHTYKIIREAIDREECPDSQFVKVEFLVGYDPSMTAEIAEGLNSSVQVQEKTLAEQRGQFDWVKAALNSLDYENAVAFRENETAHYDVRELVAFMTLFHVEYGSKDHPIGAFMSKEATLGKYLQDEGTDDNPGKRSFRKLQPILADVMKLQEIVASEAGPIHNEKNDGKAGNLKIVDYNTKHGHHFPFLKTKSDYRLLAGALYPTLAAFRYLVIEDKNAGNYRWRTKDGFTGVLKVWEAAAPELMRNLKETSADVNYSLSQLGKHRTLWTSQYNTVKAAYLEMLEEE